MKSKCFEIRDRHTFIPVLATKVSFEDEAESYLLRRCGFRQDTKAVFLTRLGTGEGNYDPNGWVNGTRTMTTAHRYIKLNFDALPNGAVVDVEFISGETSVPKRSERHADAFTPEDMK